MPTIESVIEAARKRWPEARAFGLDEPQHRWDEKGYTVTNYRLLVFGAPDCDGDSMASTYSAPTLPLLLEKIEAARK